MLADHTQVIIPQKIWQQAHPSAIESDRMHVLVHIWQRPINSPIHIKAEHKVEELSCGAGCLPMMAAQLTMTPIKATQKSMVWCAMAWHGMQ